MLENQKEGQYGRNRAALGVAEVREAERGPLLEVSGNVMSPVTEGSLFVVYIKFVLLKEPRDFFFFLRAVLGVQENRAENTEFLLYTSMPATRFHLLLAPCISVARCLQLMNQYRYVIIN